MRLPLLVAAWALVAAVPAMAFVAGLSAATVASAAGDAAPAGPELWVRTAAGEVLLRLPLGDDPTWEIAWVHSVARVTVRDAFAWRDGTMLLTDQRTPLIDIAGLGHIPGRGDLRDDGQGGYWIAGIDQRLADDVHRFVIGSLHAPSTLLHGGRSYDLSATHPGVRARIEVREP
jgi:hypothetical protein